MNGEDSLSNGCANLAKTALDGRSDERRKNGLTRGRRGRGGKQLRSQLPVMGTGYRVLGRSFRHCSGGLAEGAVDGGAGEQAGGVENREG